MIHLITFFTFLFAPHGAPTPTPQAAPVVVQAPAVAATPAPTVAVPVRVLSTTTLTTAPPPPPPAQTIQPPTANPGGPEKMTGTMAPPVTTGTATYAGIECVVTISGDGGSGTFSPGPAVNGSCAQYQAEYPTATVTAEPVTSTYTDGDQ